MENVEIKEGESIAVIVDARMHALIKYLFEYYIKEPFRVSKNFVQFF